MIEKPTNTLIKSLEDHGFKVNVDKTQCIFFDTKDEISLKINGEKVKGLKKAKYLGIIIDNFLKFKEHILSLAKKGKKALYILSHMSGKNWGLNSKQKLRLYRNYILPKMTYGEELFDLAPKKYLNILDKIQNQALRNIAGLRKATKTELLHLITKIDPLHIRRKKKKLELFTRFVRNRNNPAGDIYKTMKANQIRNPNIKPTLVSTTIELKKQIKLHKNNIQQINKHYPEWKLPEMHIDIELAKKISKKETQKTSMKKISVEYIENKYKNHHKIFTDASKESNLVGVGIFNEARNQQHSLRITNGSSITTGELVAIDKVFKQLNSLTNNFEDQICILTDSLGACKALISNRDKQARPEISLSIHLNHTKLYDKGLKITLLWIPSHIDIEGNEIADRNANIGRQNEHIDITCKLGYNEIKSYIHEEINDKIYRKEISDNNHPKIQFFKTILPSLRAKIQLDDKNKLLNRLRVGATKFENGSDEVYCRICRKALTIDHCLITCKYFTKSREKLKDNFYKENLDFTLRNILHIARTGKLLKEIICYICDINKVFEI